MTTDVRAYRLASIDMMRGLAIVVMAIDHTRDFFNYGGAVDPMADPNVGPSLFFTRWITHFCAPLFVFLAGTSAGLMSTRKTRAHLGIFLLTRGAWLIVVELLIVSTAWSFAPDGLDEMGGAVVIPMQVIWAIGGSMVVLAGAQALGRRACLGLGATLLLSHNLLDPVWPSPNDPFSVGEPFWVALHSQMGLTAGPLFLGFVYPILPWIGVMLLGYGASPLFEQPEGKRERMLVGWGLAMTIAFGILRVIDVYGDPNGWEVQESAFRTIADFLNVTKYPPSLIFVLMTLGPAAILCAYFDRVGGGVGNALVRFGRAPFAFYVAHLYLIHGLAVGLGVLQGFDARQFLTFSFFFPDGYGLGLVGVYVVWLLVVAMLYPLCKWVSEVKKRRRDWWLSYL